MADRMKLALTEIIATIAALNKRGPVARLGCTGLPQMWRKVSCSKICGRFDI
ncbi:MAG: hypothetical protein AAFY53_15240 [Pseudomonadota bacterium]